MKLIQRTRVIFLFLAVPLCMCLLIGASSSTGSPKNDLNLNSGCFCKVNLNLVVHVMVHVYKFFTFFFFPSNKFKLYGEVDDCECKIENIDKFNNYRIYPRLSMLVKKDYFRFIKVNLNKICRFWPDDARCSIKDCQLKKCSEVMPYTNIYMLTLLSKI